MGTIKATNIEPIADNGTVTLGSSGDQFSLATGAKSSFLYPAFEAHISADQNISDAAFTKLNANTEIFDSDNMYDNSTNFRFLPTVAGKYYVYGDIRIASSTGSDLVETFVLIYKNGSNYKSSIHDPKDLQGTAENVSVSAIIDMNGSSDYVELFGYINVNSGTPKFGVGTKSSSFGAYRIGT